MIADEKIISIAKRLLEKSRSNEVNWQQAYLVGGLPTFRVTRHPDGFYVGFAESKVGIRRLSPQTEPDFIEISIYRSDNTLVKSLWVQEDCPHWPIASGLYDEAERFVTGWDKVLSDLEDSLRREGKIGLQPSASTTSPSDTDQEIPY